MKEHNFFTEIAFIPWNFRRYDNDTIRLFKENPDYLGICVHGCDHTAGEFAYIKDRTFDQLASTALWRMEKLKKYTGLSYDPVMVFPQGYFSSEAILALKKLGYLAAVNSTIQSVESSKVEQEEYKHPFTSIYHDFPLFLRRYPDSRKNFMEDIKNERPILIVEHHQAFRNGYREITDFIDWINEQGNLRWTNLSEIVRKYRQPNSSEIHRRAPESSSPGVFRRIKVALRRYACEIRDNHVETNKSLNKLYKSISSRIK